MSGPFPVQDFIAGRLPAQDFGHRAHLEAAHALLLGHDFATAANLYSGAVRSMAASVGHPGKFHATITIAMMSAIAERLDPAQSGFASFIAANPELLDRQFLLRHYSAVRLASDLARSTFILPDQPAQ